MTAIWRIPGKVLRKDYPISGPVNDWYFRISEVSSGVWVAEGADIWGRNLKRESSDRNEVLAHCEKDARSMPSMIVP